MNESNETRARLVEATLAVVREHGVAGATSRQIAAAAGTNLQAITYHFGSKDDLVANALVGAVRSWVEPIRELLTDLPEDPAGRLLGILSRLDDVANQVVDQVPGYLEALAQVPRREEYRAEIRQLLADLRTDVAEALTRLQDAGLLGDWIEPQAMAAFVIAAADGVAVHMALDPDAATPAALLEQAGHLLLSALLPTPGADSPESP